MDTGNTVVECKARGHFRKDKLVPCVGDKVEFTPDKDGKGAIDRIFSRKNIFVRPPVANIDTMIIVASLKNPSPDLAFIDKMLTIASVKEVDVMLCFNKWDLDSKTADELSCLYGNIGYKTFKTSAVQKLGIDEVREVFCGKIVAFSGFSGVGKSSLLNCVMESDVMQTGDVSERLRRGKHTTRHVELVPYNGGYIVDTPGFSMLDFPDEVTKDSLKDYFCEFEEFSAECKFRDCNHTGNSSVCSVCKAYEDGKIASSRFTNYIDFYNILAQRKEWKK